MATLFTTKQVIEATGIPGPTIENWVHAEVVRPAKNANAGTGNHRAWTLPQVIGLAVAQRLREAERGCALSYVAEIVRAFGLLTEDELLRRYGAGDTHLLTISGNSVILSPPTYPDQVNVQRLHQQIVNAFAVSDHGSRQLSPAR